MRLPIDEQLYCIRLEYDIIFLKTKYYTTEKSKRKIAFVYEIYSRIACSELELPSKEFNYDQLDCPINYRLVHYIHYSYLISSVRVWARARKEWVQKWTEHFHNLLLEVFWTSFWV